MTRAKLILHPSKTNEKKYKKLNLKGYKFKNAGWKIEDHRSSERRSNA